MAYVISKYLIWTKFQHLPALLLDGIVAPNIFEGSVAKEKFINLV